MRSFWRGTQSPLHSHADWRARLEKKNSKQGTSAPTLASVWAGPLEFFGALHRQPAFVDVALDRLVVEAQSSFDEYPGGRRNHDVVVHGHLPNGARVVVCVEAKAGEDLGLTVAQQRKAAAAAKARTATSNAEQRLESLLRRFVPYEPDADRVQQLRYQLLTALAGTEAEAATADAGHAVMMVHDFLTDQRPEDTTAEHDVDIHRFCTTVFDCEPPGPQHRPWCFEVPRPAGMTARLYLARAVTDLRGATLEAGDGA